MSLDLSSWIRVAIIEQAKIESGETKGRRGRIEHRPRFDAGEGETMKGETYVALGPVDAKAMDEAYQRRVAAAGPMKSPKLGDWIRNAIETKLERDGKPGRRAPAPRPIRRAAAG